MHLTLGQPLFTITEKQSMSGIAGQHLSNASHTWPLYSVTTPTKALPIDQQRSTVKTTKMVAILLFLKDAVCLDS